jgi:hypothetical protein
LARLLLDSIPLTRVTKKRGGMVEERPCLVGLRDRALISVMTFTFARIGAAVAMDVPSFAPLAAAPAVSAKTPCTAPTPGR